MRDFARALLGIGASIVVVLVGAAAPFALVEKSHGASAQTERKPNENVVIALTGDVMLGRNVTKSIERNGRQFSYLFEEVAPYLREADIAFCNLESPISNRGERNPRKAHPFRAPPAAAQSLSIAGYDLVSLANNHALDFGPDALNDTKRLLESVGVRYLGLSIDDAEQTPEILEINGVRIGFLAWCDPLAPAACARSYDVFEERPAKGIRDQMALEIKALREKADVVVVSMHWGVEAVPEPDQNTSDLGRYLIDAGAHIVAGHHPHVQWESQLYNGGLILYSMGNFIFDQHTQDVFRDSTLYRVIVNKAGLLRGEYLPIEIAKDDWQPRPTQSEFIPMSAN